MASELEELVEAGRRIAVALRQLGDDCEVFLLRNDAYSIEVHDDELRPEIRVGRVQVGMRLLRDGAMTQASTASLDAEENVAALRAAMAVSRPAPVADFAAAQTSLQDGIDPSLRPWIQDPALVQDLAEAIRRRFVAAPRSEVIGSFEASCALRLGWRAVVTARGEGGTSRGALVSFADLDANHYDQVYRAVIDDQAVEALEHVGVRLLEGYPDRDVSPDELGVRGERVQAVLAPRLVEGIVRTVLQEKLLASTVASGGTHLAPGKGMFGANFTLDALADDAHLANCGPCDDEGTPTQRVRVIERGCFRSFVSSRASARRTGLPETGNGTRAPLFDEERSEALVRDRLTGIEIAAGSVPVEQLIASMERGVVLYSLLGLHGADKSRARFTATARGGFAVREGKVVGRLAPGHWSIAGRLFDDESAPSIFAEAEPSREQVLTGTGRVPWMRAHVDVG